MISYRFVPTSSQKGVLFLRHPVVESNFHTKSIAIEFLLIFFTTSMIYVMGMHGWLVNLHECDALWVFLLINML